ncbi:MAG: ferrochelatase [Gemmatimonadaceae bacterium]
MNLDNGDSRPTSTHAVLLMAYGTPETLDQVEPYFTHIRGGRPPSAEAVANLRRRYELVGGRTPLLEITRTTARALEEALNVHAETAEERRRVYVGMKHWHPYIGDVMRLMAADGITRVTALTLAPHYSRISLGGYRKAMDEAQSALERSFDVTFIERWHAQPEFIEMMTALVQTGLEQFDASERDSVVTVFSAHSLPVRIREWNDPYEQELLESSEATARAAGLNDWRFAWQSAGETGEPWLGPDILDYLETLHAEGMRNVLQVPIGFVSEHLEILWDIDHEAKEKAAELGMKLYRTALPNDSPAMVRALAAVVAAAESGRGAV